MLKLSVPAKTDTNFHEPVLGAKKFNLEPNSKNIEAISLNEKNHVLTLTIKTKDNSHSINFGNARWIEGETKMHGPSLVEGVKNHFIGLPVSKIAGAYRWKGPDILELKLRYIDSPHTLTMTFHFESDKITADMLDSFRAPDKKITLKGESVK